LPGGGVEHGETLATALARELREEGNIELLGPAELYGVYWNRRTARRDHVALYVVLSFRQTAPPQPNSEIVAHGFFATDAFPEGTTVSTRARVAEVLGGRDAAEIW
jgi:ADP-ribose pyrophosphatase YjhB (NUDIX family)